MSAATPSPITSATRPGSARLGYTSYQSELNARAIPANQVWHVMDRRMDGTTVRGWPKISAAYDDLARVDDAFGAFVRAMIRRAAIGIALSRDAEQTEQPQNEGVDDYRFPDGTDDPVEGVGDPSTSDEAVQPYQEAEAKAGDLLILEPGYEPENISTGSPSSPQEAELVRTIERRVCGALRISPMTLLGDYRAVSYSAPASLPARRNATPSATCRTWWTARFTRGSTGISSSRTGQRCCWSILRSRPTTGRYSSIRRTASRSLPIVEKAKVIPGRGEGIRGRHLRSGAIEARGRYCLGRHG